MVEYVERAAWIKCGNKKTCSNCAFIYYSNNDNFAYCPSCGSKMDGKGEGV